MSDITLALQRAKGNDPGAASHLLELVYNELRSIAAAYMAREGAGQTLQATALVHEAWLQLAEGGTGTWKSRAHFFGTAAIAMRRILVDVARRKNSQKRGAGRERVSIDCVELSVSPDLENILIINQALERLEREDPEQSRIVVLKFFGGMTNQEVAAYLGISERTVYRHWVCAKTRMYHWIRQEE